MIPLSNWSYSPWFKHIGTKPILSRKHIGTRTLTSLRDCILLYTPVLYGLFLLPWWLWGWYCCTSQLHQWHLLFSGLAFLCPGSWIMQSWMNIVRPGSTLGIVVSTLSCLYLRKQRDRVSGLFGHEGILRDWVIFSFYVWREWGSEGPVWREDREASAWSSSVWRRSSHGQPSRWALIY